ncbi:ParA family protein [Frankia sp. CiP1_Cm_nod1]|uniref:ParA family protein n=1 Tax=Frankia sp. CiP1_Cm_nod1 TaxID=2897160 RepID=UPI004044164D
MPAPEHLYTWVDVDEYFASLAAHGKWPPWLLEVDAFWDEIELTVAENVRPPELWAWLTNQLGPLTVDAGHEYVLLESADGDGRPLPVRLRVAEQVEKVERRPRWQERRIVRQLAESIPPPDDATFAHDVQLCAFHSFKGGVGRTLHCVALARELASRPGRDGRRNPVLLVDADLEAPGITWMLAAQGQRMDFALEDFLALLHGSSASERDEVIAIGRRFLLNQQLDNVIVLPARRDPVRLGPPRIEPVDLLTHDRPAYFLTESLAELAHALGTGTILLDLRAGASELNSPILLDPRVLRVFVTTMSDQSLRGTEHILQQIAHRAPARQPSDPQCRVIITQFDSKEHKSHLAAAEATLTSVLAATSVPAADSEGDFPDDTRIIDQDIRTAPLPSPFVPQLLALPGSWNDVAALVDQADIRPRVMALAEILQPTQTRNSADAAGQATPLSLPEARRRLHEWADRLKYAESTTDEDGFLPTEPLTNLVSAHRTEAPIEIMVGAKGSGKTFTYLRMCRRPTWSEFAEAAGVNDAELAANLVPVLASRNLEPSIQEEIRAVQNHSAARLTGSAPATGLELTDLISNSLESEHGSVTWRRIWLALLARAAGLEATPDDAEEQLTTLARQHQAIFVIDGLEDIFQEFSKDSRQQQALRALLTGCTEWLRSLRGHPLGLVVFVRRDLVLSAIRQNTDQFLTRHQAYELRWNRTEALRLAAWVCERSSALRPPAEVTIKEATDDVLSRLLFDVWGQKLGSLNSREARSEEWFFAALSDFNRQIQARDIVSFLSVAARYSAEDKPAVARWPDRLLTPTAMRRALPECSRDKIGAISQENPPVGMLFTHLQGLPEESRKMPFTLETVNVNPADARLLEANGVLFRENDQYWIPEIYRHGLGFGLSGTGRPRVIAIAKSIRGRGGSG